MTTRQRIMLIDGHALAFRAFYALADKGLRTSGGEPTYAVFGFASIMLNAIREHQPSHVAVSFDIGRTFRDDLYDQYKAGRGETPTEFPPQLDRIKEMMHAFNIPIYVAEGFEADDVLGTLARQAAAAGVETLILTGDSDTLQLVDPMTHVLLANPFGQKMTSIEYDYDKVVERYEGLRPNQLADLRGLKGDASDNIPGVKGIGEKGAIALLNQFGTIDAIYADLASAPKRYHKVLDGQQQAAEFSRHLATIVTTAPVELVLEDCVTNSYDKALVVRFFQNLEIGKTLIDRLPPTGQQVAVAIPEPVSAPTKSAPRAIPASGQMDLFSEHVPAQAVSVRAGYETVLSAESLASVVQMCRSAGLFAFDTETTGTSVFLEVCVGISISCAAGTAWYIPVQHTGVDCLPLTDVVAALAPLFADPAVHKVGHNAKFDIEVLLRIGIPVVGLTFDTMLAASLLDKRRGLKDLAFYELKLETEPTNIDELIGKGKNQITLDKADIAAVTNYAGSDADYTLQLYHKLHPAIAAVPTSQDVLYKLEMPLIPVLVRMEAAGILVDDTYLSGLSTKVSQRIKELETQIYTIAGGPFNIASSDQLSDVLFGKLGLPTQGLEKTKTGRWSLTADVLEKLRANDTSLVIDLILSHRQLSKLKSTYIDAIPALLDAEKRVHTTYNQLGAATGRLSSNDPNLQNIPTRTEEGREVRRAFVAAPGHVLVAADYSQIELRVLAHITQDANLIQAFREDQDIHAATAAQLFNIPIEQVDKDKRRLAKTTVFGVIYGISAFGLAQRTSLSRSEAQQLIDGLFARFPEVRNYIDRTIAEAHQTGWVSSLFGRRRSMPDINVKGPRQQAAERESINHPIQATAADIMKMAMLRVDAAITAYGNGARLLLQVHDELIVEVPQAHQQQIADLLRHEMSQAFAELAVPLKVDVEAGTSWDQLTEV